MIDGYWYVYPTRSLGVWEIINGISLRGPKEENERIIKDSLTKGNSKGCHIKKIKIPSELINEVIAYQVKIKLINE